jgi:hypothetical protein
MPEPTGPVLEYYKDSYDIQMLESLNIPEGKELFCTEHDLYAEELFAVNEYAKNLGLISKKESIQHLQIRAINDNEKLLLGVVAEDVTTKKRMTFYVKEDYGELNSQLANFTVTKKCTNGRDHTEWCASGVITDQVESEYLFLLHNILLSHGILRDSPEFLQALAIKEAELEEKKKQEQEEFEQHQLEIKLESLEAYVLKNGPIKVENQNITIEAWGTPGIFYLVRKSDGNVVFTFTHESKVDEQGALVVNSYLLEKGIIKFWGPKSMIKLGKYSGDIFEDTFDLLSKQIGLS